MRNNDTLIKGLAALACLSVILNTYLLLERKADSEKNMVSASIKIDSNKPVDSPLSQLNTPLSGNDFNFTSAESAYGITSNSSVSGANPSADMSTELSDLKYIVAALHKDVKNTIELVNTVAKHLPKGLTPEQLEQKVQLDAAREEAVALKMQRNKERLMLDLPDDSRAIAYHERWLQENQEKVWSTSQEFVRINKLAKTALANEPK